MHLEVRRLGSSPQGTLSTVTLGGYSWHGLECPRCGNDPHTSCIPGGQYRLVRHASPRFGATWAFVGGTVAQALAPWAARIACLIHAGNTVADVSGCLIVGRGVSRAPALRLTDCKPALAEVLRLLDANPEPHACTITWA
ncbi:MAG: DUF5675 family protein [Candidatus Latescibacterota bacterium]